MTKTSIKTKKISFEIIIAEIRKFNQGLKSNLLINFTYLT